MNLISMLRAVLCSIVLMSSTAQASSIDQQDFNQMLLNAFREDPQLLLEGVRQVQKYQSELKREQQEVALRKVSKSLYYDEDSPVFNPDGEITVVEFFDYMCGVCKRVSPEMKRLIESDQRVRFVYKDVSILGPTATQMSKYAIAVSKLEPSKYPAFHYELMGMRQPSEESALKLASLLDIDAQALKQMAQSQEVASILQKNNQLFNDLQLTGTPTIFVGKKKFPGAVGYSTLIGEVNAQYEALIKQQNAQAVNAR
ncbi:DsbA family protein (plasmid) [Vibrio scophthalmi]|uniref:DsbA family protein n=1 Tax=Vibrio scophthalmi TaxID=45658 RepID=UPI003EBD481B